MRARVGFIERVEARFHRQRREIAFEIGRLAQRHRARRVGLVHRGAVAVFRGELGRFEVAGGQQRRREIFGIGR